MMIGGFDLKGKFEKSLRGLKANKAPGVDLIAAEFLQNLEEAEKISLSYVQNG